MPPLLSDSRGRTVSAQYLDAVTQGEELLPDRGHEGLVVSPEQVCPSYGAGKEGVAHKDLLFLPEKITDPSGCVPRCMEHLELQRADTDGVALGDKSVGRGRKKWADAEGQGLHGGRLEEKGISL